MPKNAGIGGKKRKMGKKNHHNSERELCYKEEMQDYAQVLRLLGDSRLEVQCMDGVKRMAHIRGTMRKKIWIAMGDVVLVALREYEADKCDIILKYTEDEVRKLKSLGEIPASIKLPENENQDKDDAYEDIVFERDNDDDENEDNVPKKKNNKKDLPSSDSESSDEEKELDIDNI
jgi:translation initiation factor 1A